MDSKIKIAEYFNSVAVSKKRLHRKKKYYHKLLEKYFSFIVPSGSKVLELGCGEGDLLNAVKPHYGVGIDIAEEKIKIARSKYPELNFITIDAENFELNEKFDYVIISDLTGYLWDVQHMFSNLKMVCDKNTRIVISSYSYFWEPILKLFEFIGLKQKQPLQNWLSMKDLIGLLELEGYEIIKTDRKILLPIKLPLLNYIFNNFISNLPLLNHLCLVNLIVTRKRIEYQSDLAVSIIIPAKNEKGNIEHAILRTPVFGKSQEFVFVEGNSKDGTFEEMLRIQMKYNDKNIIVDKQTETGKGNAVREGFDKATGDILMILDADLTTPPEDLIKFYEAIKFNRGEFINGCRLVYPMEKEAMRLLNLFANKFFGLFFTYVLGQKVKDTLCGTKVLRKEDYEKIKLNRKYFGEFDPFGDFDLLFGAAKLNLKIVEIPVRYRDREYGSTQISRFKHGWLLIKMSFFASKKIKFI